MSATGGLVFPGPAAMACTCCAEWPAGRPLDGELLAVFAPSGHTCLEEFGLISGTVRLMAGGSGRPGPTSTSQLSCY